MTVSATPTPSKPAEELHTATCRHCGQRFVYRHIKGRPKPPSCGQIRCRALAEWGPDEWAGAARMAEARQRAGVDLSELDHDALHRALRGAA